MTSQPFYNCKPIRGLTALSLALQFDKETLVEIAGSANTSYRLAKAILKPDGTSRQPFDALPPLKDIQRRIKDRIFAKVSFPYYLTGSLRGRDYRTNAELHVASKLIVCEDITRFFPSTSSDIVFDIWRFLFGFSEDVSKLLTTLTTKDGALPEGAITSSYLANLAFWRFEPRLHDLLKEQGVQYSRYVDDITFSSRTYLPKPRQTEIIALIYGMLRRQGYKAKRRKHEQSSSGRRMITTKLLINRRAAIIASERAKVRAAVHQLEIRARSTTTPQELSSELTKVAGRVSNLSRFHPTEGIALMERLNEIRKQLVAARTLTSLGRSHSQSE